MKLLNESSYHIPIPLPGGDRGIGESYFVVVMCSDDDYLFWTYIPLRDAALLVLPHSFRSCSPRS